MRLALLIVATLLAAAPALAHSWYPLACCGNIDCFPVACDQLVETVSGWLYIPSGSLFKREQVQPSQDRHCHVCLGHGCPALAHEHASELSALRWEQVDLVHGLLHVARVKNGKPSVHPLTGKELRALRRLQREQEPGALGGHAGRSATQWLHPGGHGGYSRQPS
jgi:hypothetical protein